MRGHTMHGQDLPEEDPLALESQVCFALTLASRSVIAAYRPVLEPMNLTHPQYLVMLALWEHSTLSIKELGRHLSIDSGTLSPLLKRLEGHGYIFRKRSPDDARTVKISLTEKGKELRKEAEKVPGTMMKRLGMDEAEVRALHASMMKVIAAAQNPSDPGDA
ncbi:MarR family winged helix-turn-helix transcriptional regulator [Kocuria sp. HSID16901]|uniref:MarR family winged helix-turn-helix transcriptional regulator n=1 Tax=Kocuria sp. HSID16901 TaxID=2419505 RepID=UPI001EE93D63|nr:MarR family transcriptional regulator [Kocuria sp. HSID16901]MCT1368279.1 MarR family transcriptional regulator [Rothia sp. p3-SID1597]